MAGYFQWMQTEFGFSDKQGEALHLQSAAVPRRQEQRHAGLRDVGALRGREAGQVQAEDLSARRQRLQLLLDADRDAAARSVEKKPGIVQRFVDASMIGWYNYLYGDNKPANDADQEAQPGNDRRADRLFHRQDEGVRDRRQRRLADARASAR